MFKILIASIFFLSFISAIEQVTILGSGPAGLTAAIYASRAGLSPLVIEGDEPGGQISYSNGIDNFPGFSEGILGYELGINLRKQAMRFGTRIYSGKVVNVDLLKIPFSLKLEDGKEIRTQTLIIASGASAKWLGLPSEQALVGKGVSSCAVCDGFLYKDKEVVVVGGGDTALEDALYLANHASKVTVIHRRSTLKASKYLQDKAFSNHKIQFIWDSAIDSIAKPENGTVTEVAIRHVLSGKTQVYPCQGVFIAIGHAPNTDLFKGQLELDHGGYVITKPFTTQTSVAGVFAAGDVADPHYRQAITAAGRGCAAAIDAYHFIQEKSP